MTEATFQLPIDGYETLVRILGGYAEAGADDSPAFLADIEAATAMAKSQISRNNKFFVSTGILERKGRGFKLTSDGLSLARVLDHFRDNTSAPEVQSAWRTIVEKDEFLQRVTAAVRVRGSMDSEAFARHIALTSGAPNKPRYMTGARTVIAILKAANKLAEDEEGVLTAIQTEQLQQDLPLDSSSGEEMKERLIQQTTLDLGTLARGLTFVATVQITPTTSDDELIELARKVRLFTRLISERDEMEDPDA